MTSKFSKLVAKLSKKPGVKNPQALAAWIGRKKYGAKEFKSMSHKESVNRMIDAVAAGQSVTEMLDEQITEV